LLPKGSTERERDTGGGARLLAAEVRARRRDRRERREKRRGESKVMVLIFGGEVEGVGGCFV